MNNSNQEINEVEVAYLGIVILNAEALNKTIFLLSSDDFFEEKHRNIFTALRSLNEENLSVDITLLKQKLNSIKPKVNFDVDYYVTYLINNAGFLNNLQHYLELIKNNSKERQFKEVIENYSKKLKQLNDFDLDSYTQNIVDELIKISSNNTSVDINHISPLIDETILKILSLRENKGVVGISTGFDKLDEMTSGFQRGDLFILAARPAMGKTSFALNLATKVSKKHYVAFFSFEMPASQLITRILACQSNVDISKFRDPQILQIEELEKISRIAEITKKNHLYIDDSVGVNLSELIWKCKQLQKNNGLDVVFIDYLQLINIANSNGNRQQEVSYISRQLKLLARELNITVIALSQLSRKVESREDKMPILSDLRESGSIEQDADIVSFLYRPEYYDKSEVENYDYSTKNDFQEIQLNLAKHRNGAIGTIKFGFKASSGIFITNKN